MPKQEEKQYKDFNGQFVSKRKREKRKTMQNEKAALQYLSSGDADFKNVKKHKKHKKKDLEIEHLRKENAIFSKQLKTNEEFYNKKINESKEMLESLNKYNEELAKENELLRTKSKNLLNDVQTYQKELSISKDKCQSLKVTLDKFTNELRMTKKRNEELENDLHMLKTVVYRLNFHLDRYQSKLQNTQTSTFVPTIRDMITANKNSTTLPEEHSDHHHVPASWGNVNTHTLGPLLDAYQELVTEKECLIEQYEEEISKFSIKLKEIVEENEILHKKLTEDENCSLKLKAYIKGLEDELKMTKEHNDLLLKKCSLKQNELEEVLELFKQKGDQLKRDHNALLIEYQKCRNEVLILKEQNKNLMETRGLQQQKQQQTEDLIPVSVHENSIQECRRLYEELKSQYEKEKSQLTNNIASMSTEIKDLNRQILRLNSEKSELQRKIKEEHELVKKLEEQCRDLQKKVKKLRSQKSALRKQLDKVMAFARDLVLEQESLLKAFHDKVKENVIVKRTGNEMYNKMNDLKAQLKTVQTHAWKELTNVEEEILDKENIISSIQQRHDQEVKKLKRIIQEKESQLARSNVVFSLPPYIHLKDKTVLT